MVACIDFFETSEICRPKFIVRHSTTKWGNDQILTSSVLVVKFFYFKLLILCLINTCYNLLVLWIDL
jgi:hypothetical protein